MRNQDTILVLLLFLVLTVHTVKSQEPCSSPGPNIAGSVFESSFINFDPNSELYRTDTFIEGINQGTDVNSGVTLTIIRSTATPSTVNLNDLFELIMLPATGAAFGNRAYIRLKQAIDRDGTSFTASDDLDTIEFEINCVSRKRPTESKFFLMQLEIKDINDNAPIFANAPYTVAVAESAPVGTTVYSGISATDLDAGTNKKIDYAIVPGDGTINDGSTRFALPITSRGEIIVSNPLDFESVQQYVLTISATDKASNTADRKATTTTITITINDVDDLRPKFVYSTCVVVSEACFNPTYSANINGSLNTPLVFSPVPVDAGNPNGVVGIIAQDRDTLNAPITFYLPLTLPSGYQNRFQVTTQQVSGSPNQYQAIITQTSAIDRSQVPELELYVEAKESLTNRYSDRATIKVTVQATNNNNPVLTVPFQGFINENSPVGTIPRNNDGSNPLKISVTDPDLLPGETGTYTFTVSGTGLFRVNSEGFVEAAAVINYESTPSVTFTVTGTEVGTQNPRSGTVQVTVIVRDLNDNTPVFGAQRYETGIVEGDYSTSNQVLLDVSANDADTGANGDIAYSIQSVSNNGLSKFSIQPNAQTGRATISCIGSVADGEIYVITVRATDQGQPVSERRSVTVPVEVTVTPLGTRPPVIDATAVTISVSEAVPVASSVWSVPASDPEGLPLTFTILSGNNNNDFALNSTTGELRTARLLNREAIPQYTLNIQVRDQTSQFAQTTLTIIIQDVNDNNPAFTQSTYTFSVLEGRTNEAVGTVTATDQDQGINANVVYQISPYSSTGSANLFSISQSGDIQTASALDYETRTSHVILVLGIDGGASARTGTATVTINVRDIEDVIPLFTETNIERSVNERQPISTSVAQVTALDQDTAKRITYTFSGGESSAFNINANSGIITTNQVLQYETKNRYVFTVTTNEGAGSNALSATATVTINVLDKAYNTSTVDRIVYDPKFVYSTCAVVIDACFNPIYTTNINGSLGIPLLFNPVPVDANNPNGVVSIIAQNRDTLNAPVAFSLPLTLPSGYQNRFQVTTQQVSGSPNQYQAIITQTSAIDRSQVPELELYVEAKETLTNRYSDRATIKVTVQATNNNNPVLTVPFQGFINENSPVGTIPRNNDESNPLKISVTDSDLIPGETGTYTLTVFGTGLFRVNSEGFLEAAAVIDYESTTSVTFTVTGTEVGTQNPRIGTVLVTVKVRDLNDNNPIFGAPRYETGIVEGDYSTLNQVLLDVSASDADTGANGDIAYSIQSVSNNGLSKFSIQPNAQTGRATISCIGSVADGKIYVITVQATDQGQPASERRSVTVPVEVTVTPLGSSDAVPVASSVWPLILYALKELCV